MPPGFHLLISAQFASALADNALLIVTMALLAEQGQPAWWAPMLKLGFTLSYVLLAPVVGPLADAVPKARLMAWMNALKVVGALMLLAGVHPVAGFAVVGLGAAAYAPAKYGLITELVPGQQLVAANGWIEVTVVCAALLGTVLGGGLVSPWLTQGEVATEVARLLHILSGTHATSAYAGSLFLIVTVYLLAGALNLGIPDSGARYPAARRDPIGLCRDFLESNARLWRDRDGGLSLAVTTVLWGVGATLQFAVLKWASDVLDLTLDKAAYMQAAVAAGVIAGAWAAGRFVPLSAARRMLPLGVGLGLSMPLIASVQTVALALPLLALVGALGGLLVVPLNALLQHRGCTVLSAGRSIAVQGFNENASVLLMLALYGALLAAEVPIVQLLSGFGLLVAAAMAGFTLMAARQSRSGSGS